MIDRLRQTDREQWMDQIEKTSQEFAAAIVSNDSQQIGQFMDDEWVIVSESGITDRERFLAVVESGELTHSAMQMIDGTARVRVYGDVAVLTGRVTNTAQFNGDESFADEWTTDVYVKRDGKWKCVLTHITSARETV
jgi:ketosteroid isomerase-like protein